MKKLYALLLVASFALVSCRQGKVEMVSKGVAGITKVCSSIASAGEKTALPAGCAAETAEVTETSAHLPAYSWDSKMMIW